MGEVLVAALAFMLIFEGLSPLISPRSWRRIVEQALRLNDGQLRFIGLASVLAGLILLALTT